MVEQDRDDWSGDELGDPSTSSGFAIERTLEEALDKSDILVTSIDGHVSDFDSRFVTGLAGPLLAAALLGAGAHFVNTLPDLDDDERTGVRGLPHRFGPRTSLLVGALPLVSATLVLTRAPDHPAGRTRHGRHHRFARRGGMRRGRRGCRPPPHGVVVRVVRGGALAP